ncbi:MAG: bifunctional nuclease family protein [Candidatus Nanopelagicales bacterium]
MIHLEVIGVHVEESSNVALLWLQKIDDDSRILEIVIGPIEAEAISLAQQGITPPRPLTHNLIMDILETFDVQIEAVHINNIQNNTFFAELVFSNGKRVSARPSDAVALAIRADVPVLATAEVYEVASKLIQRDESDGESPEEEIEAFINFLEDLNPDDFDTQP